MNLASKHILVGITGGIAAYKSAILVRLLKKANAEVRVVMTQAAQKFVAPLTLAALSENPVGVDLFDQPPQHEIRHIAWADWADLAIIAPATANIIGKAAGGIADDLLSGMILALQCPLVFAPAMHHQMWSHPAVQRNVALLKQYGYHIVEPGTGDLASGDVGVGRMREPEDILAFVTNL
ncbi:MAG: hypothetical protein C4527_05865 [Candidatus Omnitrophota bacterium]|jgi:phosphopantothenoylcysteine decarboxylase/phosphopantothenate--cysteine ligase|nr:MAG: hypothetical protein C4527_05865 [Candidatus Omnitrophota bacterium]